MILREVRTEDLDEFFVHQQDTLANLMAAFAPRNPQDRGVFDFHWNSLLHDENTIVRTIEENGQVAGALICLNIDEIPELSFWTAREFWDQGITTAAVDQFLEDFQQRPIRAMVPADNAGSQKVLTRRGFEKIGEEQSFSNARAEIITEDVLELNQP
ncbi:MULTISPECIES: GNAT family N-acetyltransferase [Auritidibacter]|uniref:GNAT family N-acetyltransferase n=1 Tax=Auritidibacter ignavus TaxID=678932 RepID=A0AAJ6APX5_9MICC|nr:MULTISPECIES: GNAT family N-acetyltransferase [Auritidibacter]AXR73832.1 N-acetyltransferase [Auritidibacter sp. NML130574]NIH72268.1 RimJ/RimL family protein N-acetyltransferase [Auritidibacter ignavus]PXA77182.1 GNAT family N-acetyltransferase [Auritidibacter sp. NML100628]PXA78977.1 GNAT family N-acetyltransferase [Auritidibacter sp. NML120636]RMX23724.1 N-acetyltransferase [Auritidibacter ignavus]